MPPGTPEVLYEVLEPRDQHLKSVLRDMGIPRTPRGLVCDPPVPPVGLKDSTSYISPKPSTPAPQGNSTPYCMENPPQPRGTLHDSPEDPMELHGSIFGSPEKLTGPTYGPRECVYQPGEWLRPLGKMEVLMATGGYYGSLNTVQALRLTSPRPLLPQDVRAAVTTVARRTELLQVAVCWRWLWPWFCRRRQVMVPFRVEQDDVMAVYYRQLEAPYDMGRGPLWRACLVPEPRGPQGQHRAVLIFAVHHCLTDAFTNMMLCRETLAVLNAELTGRQYVPPARPLPPALSDQLVGVRDMLHAAAFTVYKYFTSTFGNFNRKVYFDGALPRPRPREARAARTRVLHAELTEEGTALLLQRCKAEGVTVHACITTLAQLAVLGTARSYAHPPPEVATLRVFNCVNMRRYFPAEQRDSPGCFISIEEEETEVRAEDGASGPAVWGLAARVHGGLRRSLGEERRPVYTLPSFAPFSLLIPLNSVLTRLGWLNRNDNHMITTNMGDLQGLLGAGGGPVTPTHLLRCVSDALTGHPYTLVFHTFLGRFSLCLEYYSNKTAPEVALRFFSQLLGHITDAAAHGALLPAGGPHRAAMLHQDKFYPGEVLPPL